MQITQVDLGQDPWRIFLGKTKLFRLLALIASSDVVFLGHWKNILVLLLAILVEVLGRLEVSISDVSHLRLSDLVSLFVIKMKLVCAHLHLSLCKLSAFEIYLLKILVCRDWRISAWFLGQACDIVHFWLSFSIRIVPGARDVVRSCSGAQKWVGIMFENFERWVSGWLSPCMTLKITLSAIQLVLWSIVKVLFQFLSIVSRKDSIAAGSYVLGTRECTSTLDVFHLHQLADVVVGLAQRPHRMRELGNVFFNICVDLCGCLLSFLGCCNRPLGCLCNRLCGVVLYLDKVVWNELSAWLCRRAPLIICWRCRNLSCLLIGRFHRGFQLLLLCYLFNFRMVHELKLIGVHSVLDIAVQAVILVALVVVPVPRICGPCAKVFGVGSPLLWWAFWRFHELKILTCSWVLGSDRSRFAQGSPVGLGLLLFSYFAINYRSDLHVFRVTEEPKFDWRRLVCADMGNA